MLDKINYNSEIKTYLKARKQLVDETLKSISTKVDSAFDVSNLESAYSYTVLLDGKRIRPIMALAVYEIFGDDIEKILIPACAIELIHAGSLMLDDLPCMDDAEYRRGEKASHIVHGESVTILASAGLWVQAFDILADIKDISINELIHETSDYLSKRGIILGQYLDLFAFDKVQTIEELDSCYELKTSGLFRLAVAYGTILGGASQSERQKLDEYARLLGIAFQIRDDIIDVTETKEQSGKDQNKDSENNKANYVSLIGLEESTKQLNTYIDRAIKSVTSIDRDTSRLSALADLLRM